MTRLIVKGEDFQKIPLTMWPLGYSVRNGLPHYSPECFRGEKTMGHSSTRNAGSVPYRRREAP